MATKKQTTAIQWVKNSDGTAGYAINLWIGCSKVSPACDNCYAEISHVAKCLVIKWGDNEPHYKCNPYKKITAIHSKLSRQFHAWELAKEQFNVSDDELIAKGFIKPARIRIFINPDSDIFDNKAQQEWRDEFWAFVETTHHIDYILVTKRIGNAKRMIPQSWLDNGYPDNVWQLITVCNQEEADRDIPKILELNAVVRGLSIEPMLGEIDLEKSYPAGKCGDICYPSHIQMIDWIISGGESGKNARPMNPQWACKIRDQCVYAGVSFFHKQNGEWVNVEDADLSLTEINKHQRHIFDENNIVYKVGTKRAGNLLGGQLWQQMPEVKNG
jgi:protein gp37